MPCLVVQSNVQCTTTEQRQLFGGWLACESFCWAWLSYSWGATAGAAARAAALRLPWHCIVRSAGRGLLAFSGSGSGDPTGGRQQHCKAPRPQPTPGYRPTDQALLLQLGCFTRSGVPPALLFESTYHALQPSRPSPLPPGEIPLPAVYD